MFRRLLPAALALASALSLSSCLDYDEELTIHENLSGELSAVVTLPDTILGKYEQVGVELERAKLEKRLASADGVELVSYQKTEGRQPKITMVFKFTSLEKLNDAIAANPPASIVGGKFTITKKDGLVTVDRKMGVGTVQGEMPAANGVFYKTHFDGKITATNSPQYNSPAKDVRYRYQLSELMARQPTQSTTFSKDWPWLLILGCLAAVAGAAWYGWEYFGKRKPGSTHVVPPPPGPATVPTPEEPPAPQRPGPPQPRRPGPPPR
jgi:hypothetical protein